MVERHVANVIMGVRFSLPAHIRKSSFEDFLICAGRSNKLGACYVRIKNVVDSFSSMFRSTLNVHCMLIY